MSDPIKAAVLYCPFCKAQGLNILSVAEDYRSVVANCPTCRRNSRLAFPPIQTPLDD